MSERPAAVGEFNYLGPMDGLPVVYPDRHDCDVIALDPRVMSVHDMRKFTTPASLSAEGFMHGVLPLDIGDERDPDAIAKVYDSPLSEYIQAVSGASKVILMSRPLLRWSDSAPRPDKIDKGPSYYVHSDFLRGSFHAVARQLVKDDPDRERWLSGRYAVIQTWRALSRPPQDRPLAVLDRRTIAKKDVVLSAYVFGPPDNEDPYFNYSYRYNPGHRWAYISNMDKDDLLLFIGFDNDDDSIPGIPHSSFDNTANHSVAHPRMSLEYRAVVYWG